MDNFYSSPELFKDFLSMNSSTLHSNRWQFPESLKAKAGEPAKPRGTATFAYHDKLTVLRWTDNKDVHAISTLYSDSLTTVQHQVDGQREDVPCPDIISYHSSFMGGVDLADQVMCYYFVG